MITFSNLRAGETLAYTVGVRAACELLDALIAAVAELASARWEHELAAWLSDRRRAILVGVRPGLDLGELAWTPEHFVAQQAFVVASCSRAAETADDERLAVDLARLADLAARYRRDDVLVGRRWRWVGDRPTVKI